MRPPIEQRAAKPRPNADPVTPEPEPPPSQTASFEDLRHAEAEEPAPEVIEAPATPDDAHLVEDRYIGVRVDHTFRPAGPLPPEEASHAGEAMTGELQEGPLPENPSPPLQDVRVTPDEPSVFEAAGKPKT